MLPDLGTRLDGLPRELVHVRDLEEFEGPILSELRPRSGQGIYLEKWCARDGDVSRWLIVRTEQRLVAEYLGGRIGMLELLNAASDGIGFLWDRRAGQTVGVHLVQIATLPERYLPKHTAMHDESLRPDWRTVPQSFLLDEAWDPYEISRAEKRYLDVTSFGYLTKINSGRSLPRAVLRYDMDRGFPMATAFTQLRAHMPGDQRPRSVAVAANSPGVLTLEASADVAADLKTAVASLGQAKETYERILRWTTISPKNVDRMPDANQARQELSALCRSLNVSTSAVLPAEEEHEPGSVLIAGKLVASYYRKLRALLDDERAQFISARVED